MRFTGTYTSKSLSQRAFHFDSWRLKTLSIMWMPAYIYTQEFGFARSRRPRSRQS